MKRTLLFLFVLCCCSTILIAQTVTHTDTFRYSGSIVKWTVPPGVTSLTIQARGVEGQTGSAAFAAGLGASMQGTFAIVPGTVLKILVGQHMPSGGYDATGGGGSFVTDTFNNPLIIAGGGGGGGLLTDGIGGFSGQAYVKGGSQYSFSGGGEGFVSDGGGGGGGGGGYSSGGGGGVDDGNNNPGAAGGGGGSINNGTPQLDSTGVNHGNGLVTITYQSPLTLTCGHDTTVYSTASSCGVAVTYTAPSIPKSVHVSDTFFFTGARQSFVVPAGVSNVNIQAWGAQGGTNPACGSDGGGFGGFTRGNLAVSTGDSLFVFVGGQPAINFNYMVIAPGGYNGGGTHGSDGGGGGGASDVRKGDTLLSSRIIVAGGGGGGYYLLSCSTGGAGGGLQGGNGQDGSYNVSTYPGGGGGTQTAGGTAGFKGEAGTLGQGGNAVGYQFYSGGGGGYYGGGGSYIAGGGGGSGYIGGVTGGSTTAGVQSGNGLVVISYDVPLTYTLTQKTGLPSGATFPLGATANKYVLYSGTTALDSCTLTVTVKDTIKPVIHCPVAQQFCFSSNHTYTVPKLSATDNCKITDTSFTISGATTRSGKGSDASGVFNTGTSTITWTVTDSSGNQSTCTTMVKVNPQITASIADAKALSSGVSPNTVYMGYAPASSLTLTAQASGGSGHFSYQWSNGATTQSIKVSPTTNTVYTVTVKDSAGCTAMASKGVTVTDVRCGNKMDKVSVCHNGNNTLCIDANAVPAHLSIGDYLGSCGSNTGSFIASASISDNMTSGQATVLYPNPNKGQFTLLLNSTKLGKKEVVVSSPAGSIIERREVEMSTESQSLLFNLQGKASGTYFVKIMSDEGVEVLKVIIGR